MGYILLKTPLYHYKVETAVLEIRVQPNKQTLQLPKYVLVYTLLIHSVINIFYCAPLQVLEYKLYQFITDKVITKSIYFLPLSLLNV